MKCPKCGSDKFKVYKSRPDYECDEVYCIIMRWRECDDCNYKTGKTAEEIPHPKNVNVHIWT